jgi:hypothetical protein
MIRFEFFEVVKKKIVVLSCDITYFHMRLPAFWKNI